MKKIDKKTRILFYYAYGKNFTGAPRVIENLFKSLDRSKLNLFFASQKESRLTECLRLKGEDVTVLPLPNILASEDGKIFNYTLWYKVKAFRALFSYNNNVAVALEEKAIECIWARNIKSVLLVGIAARKCNIPLIWDIGLERESFWIKPLHWVALSLSKYVVTEAKCQHNKVFGRTVAKLCSGKMKTIYPGVFVDISESTSTEMLETEITGNIKDSNKLRILSVASVHPRKNQMLLLEALVKLHEKHPNLSVSFAGPIVDQLYFERCKQFAARNGLSEIISFLGWRDDVSELMKSHDIFVLTSNNEGIPYVIHEAMRSCLPVVATDVGGISEIVEDNISGFLVKKGDVNDLANTINICISRIQKDDLIQIKKTALSLVKEKFSPKKWAYSYTNLLLQS